MGSSMDCKQQYCCGNRHNCTGPENPPEPKEERATPKATNRFYIELGARVWDKDSKVWIHVGHRVTSIGSRLHYFCRVAENGRLYSYQASEEATIRRKFRGL